MFLRQRYWSLAVWAGLFSATSLTSAADDTAAPGGASQQEASQEEAIAEWIRDLGHPSARRRDKATRNLIHVGPAAASRLAESATSTDFEVAFRSFRILSAQLASSDPVTSEAAEATLKQLSAIDDDSVARRAVNTMRGLLKRRQTVVITALQRRGAMVNVTGDLGDPSATISIVLGDNWDGSGEDLRMLRRLENVTSLQVNLYHGGESVFTVLAELTDLESLSLTNLNVPDEQFADLAALKKLRRLELAGCMIGDRSIRHLASLTKLEHVNLNNTLITGEALAHLQKLPRLTTLSLASTRLSADEFRQLAAFKQLEQIEVSGTQFSGDSLMSLAGLEKLRIVTAQAARVTPYDVEDFADERADVAIELAGR
ncbi:MAG: hypothetical protein DWQ42_19585 [Planctomycetota bacterium]|mgnify:FL=1|nr:MAG: hypothetical protein DWQ42_19585 [Planctomycetota bacterium]REK37517.1 MAG: hypothetical protein DWQ46_22065 [Planctomycetota bacterium]